MVHSWILRSYTVALFVHGEKAINLYDASRSVSNYVGGCSVFDQANYSKWWRVQVKGKMELEGKRSDVLPEFRSGKHSQNIQCSVHAVPINLLHESALISAYHKLTDTIRAVANEPELITLDTINIERLDHWTVITHTKSNCCGWWSVNDAKKTTLLIRQVHNQPPNPSYPKSSSTTRQASNVSQAR